jgi:hypothetical protein
MKGSNTRFVVGRRVDLPVRRALLLLAPAAFAAGLLPAQSQFNLPPGAQGGPPGEPPDDSRLPNGKSKQELIVRADYDQNIKDARELIDVAKAFEEGLEKDDRYVLSLASLRKLDEIEKLTKRIRGRLKHI